MSEAMSEELDVQIAAETLSTLWKNGGAPGPRTIAVAAAATGVARSSSELLNNLSKHSLMSLPAKVYKNSRSYSKSSAAKIKRIMTRKRKPKALSAGEDDHINKQGKFGVRKRWRHFMLSAGFASLPQESRRRLRYCLHLLKLSTKSLALKVGQLNDLVQQERALQMAQKIASNHVPASSRKADSRKRKLVREAMDRLKKDIVLTIFKAVTVVSTVAGSSLPEPARSKVKSYILKLPSKWALSVQRPKPEVTDSDGAGTPMTEFCTPYSETVDFDHGEVSKCKKDHKEHNEDGTDTNAHKDADAEEMSFESSAKSNVETGNSVLMLAHESLEMLEQIISVVGQTLERAELWVQKWKRPKTKSRANTEGSISEDVDISESEYDTADEDVIFEDEEDEDGDEDENMSENYDDVILNEEEEEEEGEEERQQGDDNRKVVIGEELSIHLEEEISVITETSGRAAAAARRPRTRGMVSNIDNGRGLGEDLGKGKDKGKVAPQS